MFKPEKRMLNIIMGLQNIKWYLKSEILNITHDLHKTLRYEYRSKALIVQINDYQYSLNIREGSTKLIKS